MAGGSLSVRAGRRPRSIISLTKLSHAVMLALKPIPSHLGDVGSNHDDRDHRTQAAGAVARRRGGAHHRCHRPLGLPEPARAHGRFPGRLAVVFHDRLFGRLLDDHRRRSRSLLSPTASSNPTTILSTIVVRYGTSSSTSLGALCPSDCGPTGSDQ